MLLLLSKYPLYSGHFRTLHIQLVRLSPRFISQQGQNFNLLVALEEKSGDHQHTLDSNDQIQNAEIFYSVRTCHAKCD